MKKIALVSMIFVMFLVGCASTSGDCDREFSSLIEDSDQYLRAENIFTNTVIYYKPNNDRLYTCDHLRVVGIFLRAREVKPFKGGQQ